MHFSAALAAYGGSQARGQMGAVAARSTPEPQPRLQPTLQLTATSDPTVSLWILARFASAEP